MADTRHKDVDWNADLCTESGKAHVALLMERLDKRFAKQTPLRLRASAVKKS